MRVSTALWTLAALGLAGVVVYEFARTPEPLAEPVRSRPPASAKEIARLEGSFEWSKSRDGAPLFDLRADSGVSQEGGSTELGRVRELKLFAEDGREVVLRADRGLLRQTGKARDPEFEGALEGSVFVRSPDGVELETESIAFSTRDRLLRATSAARIRFGALDARLSGFTYNPDTGVVEAGGPVRVDVVAADGGTVDAGHAVYRTASRQLSLSTPYRLATAGRTMLAAPGALSIETAPATSTLTSLGPTLLAGASEGVRWELATAKLESQGVVPSKGPAMPRRLVAGPPATMLFSRGPGSGEAEAEGFVLDARTDGSIERAVAGPGFRVHWNDGAAAPADWTASGQWLEVERNAKGEFSSARARGEVSIEGPDGASASGSLLAWDASSPDRYVLTGDKARARRGGDLVEAPRLIVLRDRRVLIGEEGPLTEAASLKRKDEPLFGKDEPVRVLSARVTIPDGDAPIEFDGPVRAWQQDTSLRASRMRVLRAESRLVAEGDVSLTGTVGEPGSKERRRVRLDTQHLDYDGSARTARLRRGALYEEPQVQVEAEQMDIRLAAGGGVESMTAIGKVRIASNGTVGRADRMEWTGGTRGTAVLTGQSALATLESPGKGTSKSSRIVYDLASGRATLDGAGGRTVIEGRPQ